MLECLCNMNLPEYVQDILVQSKGVIIPKTRDDGIRAVSLGMITG